PVSPLTTIYLGFQQNGIYRTTNANAGAGATWTQIGNPSGGNLPNNKGQIGAIAVDPNQGHAIFATCGSNKGGPLQSFDVVRSTDGGATWPSVAGGLPNASDSQGPQTLVIDTKTGSGAAPSTTAYIGLGGPGIFKTTNAGAA